MRNMPKRSIWPLPKATARWLPVAAIAVGFGVVAMAETPSQAPQQPAQAGQTDPSQPPVFRAGVTLVTTDVIVRDQDGVFMADLTTDDFTVYEDGVEQEIASLVLVHGGRVYNQLLPAPPVQEGIIVPASRPVNDAAGRIFIFFIDDLHLQTSYTPKVRAVFEEIYETLVHEGDMFGIVSTGPSSISIDMTYDRAMLEVAMERIIGDGMSPMELIEYTQQGARGVEELRWRAHVAFKTAREIVGNLEEVENRRKAFIYVSSGYDFNPFAEARIYGNNRGFNSQGDPDTDGLYDGVEDPRDDPFTRIANQGMVFADADLSLELSELTKAANRANASFYTVDPRGLIAGPDIDYNVPLQEWNEYLFQTQGSLRVLAELTGGTAVVNRNDFEEAFKEIDAETSDYYVLGFYSSNADPTFRTRRLQVDVEREDATVRSRTHYTYRR